MRMNRATLKQIGGLAAYLIVPLVIAGAIYLVTYRRFDTPIIIDLILLAIAVILYATTNPLPVRGTLGKQMVGSSLSAVIVCIAAVGILVLLNILAQRVTVRSDLTSSQQFSVTPATIETLQKVKEPIKVTVFFSTDSGDSDRNAIQDRLKEYTSRTDKLNISYVDVNFDPARARELNIKAIPTVVFQQGNRREDATASDEQSFTRAILRVQSDVQRRVFFVTGHNERPIQGGSTGDSFSRASQALTDNNYKVDTINLFNLSTGGVITSTEAFKLNPASDVLVFGAPRGPLNDTEKQNALGFLRQGGKAMFLYDPVATASTVPVERRDNLNDLLKEWDLKFTPGIAIELDPQRRATNNPTIFIPQTTGSSEVLQNLPASPILMAQASQIDKGQNKTEGDGPLFTALLQTSVNSFLKTDLQNLSQPFDAAKDVRGPITVAATYQAPAKEPPAGAQNANTRLVLMSSYLFASDDRTVGVDPASGTGNYFFFLNTMNWLTELNDSVVIAPRQANATPFAVSQSQGSFIFWSTFLGLPLLVLFVGLAVWWRRR